MASKSKSILFSIATNGYDLKYKDCIESHKNYADRLGVEWLLINKPDGISPKDSAWIKIPTIKHFLRKDFQWVVFVDADCLIRDNAPDFRSLNKEGKYIYMANGFSGRLNSGVIIVKNSHSVKRLFTRLLLFSNIPNLLIPRRNRALFENGHFINFVTHWKGLEIISSRWNNTHKEDSDEYFSHKKGHKTRKFDKDQKIQGLKFSLIEKLIRSYRISKLSKLALKHSVK